VDRYTRLASYYAIGTYSVIGSDRSSVASRALGTSPELAEIISEIVYLGDHLGRFGYCPSRLSADLSPPYGMSLSGGWVGHAPGVPVRASALPRTALRRAPPTAATRRCAPSACAPAAAVASWPAPWCSPRTAKAVRCRPPQRWLWPALWCSPRTAMAVRPSGRHRCARRALLWPCVLVAVLWPAPRCSPRTARAVRFRPAPWCSPRTAMIVCPYCRALAGTEVLAAHCRGCVLSSAAVHGRELVVRFERRALAAVALLAPCVITLTSRHRSRPAAPLLPYQ